MCCEKAPSSRLVLLSGLDLHDGAGINGERATFIEGQSRTPTYIFMCDIYLLSV